MLRRLSQEQPESFAFTDANLAWAEAQVTKYPLGRQQSAVIPLLWRAQEQEGWLSRPAIETVAEMLGMPYIRVLEVATFYFMFQLQPVGKIAHIQICGTTSCMICGAEDLIAVCKDKIAPNAHDLSADGAFSWEEVECLGACTNAPMAQIGKDYYEDLTADSLSTLLDDLAAGKVPQVGPQNGRFASEPKSGLSSLTSYKNVAIRLNGSAALADDIGDTVKRIDGTEVPLRAPWQNGANHTPHGEGTGHASIGGEFVADAPRGKTAAQQAEAEAKAKAKTAAPKAKADAKVDSPKTDAVSGDDSAADVGTKPESLDGPRDGQPDDLKQIKGIGPKLEQLCFDLGFYHFDQIANWSSDEIAWVDANLQGFKGRVSRDMWQEQARKLAAGEDTEFSQRVKKGDVYDA